MKNTTFEVDDESKAKTFLTAMAEFSDSKELLFRLVDPRVC